MRLQILVEGKTEEIFVRDVLGPHFCRLGWHEASATRLTTRSERDRQWKGGVTNYARVKGDVELRLKQQGGDVRVTTMIDLYALPLDFPEFTKHQGDTDAYRRVTALEAAFATDIADPRFVPYLQLHEFEALLLAEPRRITEVYDVPADRVEALDRAVWDNADNPELVDDGPMTAPSKRISAAVPQYQSNKASAGPLVAQAIGLDLLRQRCRHFAEWLAKLEEMVASHPQHDPRN